MLLNNRIIIFVGAFGSGKTEIAINYVRALARKKKQVAIVDLDIVSPYFRSRDVTENLESQGIEVIARRVNWLWQIFPLWFPVHKAHSMMNIYMW